MLNIRLLQDVGSKTEYCVFYFPIWILWCWKHIIEDAVNEKMFCEEFANEAI